MEIKFFKNKKYMFIIFFSLFVIFSGYWIKNNIPKTVEIVLQLFLGPKISSEKIVFSKFGEIDIYNVVLSKNNETIVNSPYVKITYSENSLKKFRIEKIEVENPYVHIVRNDGDVNIVRAFGEKKIENNPKKKFTKGTKIPIDEITVKNAKVLYTDNSYLKPINKNIENVNGYVTFNIQNGIDLKFNGKSEDESFQYTFNNYNEPFNMNINLKNIKVDKSYIQYGYSDKKFSDASGIFNMDLTIASSGFSGEGELQNGTIKYDDINGEFKNINGKIKFLRQNIIVDFDYVYKDMPSKFITTYSASQGAKVKINLKDINFKMLENYILVKNLNLPFENFNFSDIDISLLYKKTDGFTTNISYTTLPSKINFLEIEGIKGNLIYKNKTSTLTLNSNNVSIKIPELNFTKDLNYNLIFDFSKKENINLNFNSNLITLEGKYNKKEKILALYQNLTKTFEYDFKDKKIVSLYFSLPKLFKDYDLTVIAKDKDKKLLLEHLELRNKDKSKFLRIDGLFDLKQKEYKFDSYSDDFEIGDFKFDSNLKISIKTDENYNGTITGTFDNIKYKNFTLSNLSINSKIEANKFYISEFKNNFLNLNGSLDLKNKNLDFKYTVNNFSSQINKNFTLNLKNLVGKITGIFSDINVTSDFKDAFIELPSLDNKTLKLQGGIQYKQNNIIFNKLKINNSPLSGNYNLKQKKGNIILSVNESNLQEYLDMENITSKTSGTITTYIDEKSITSDIKLNMKDLTFNENLLPNVFLDLKFLQSKNKSDIKINNLNFLGLNNKIILNSKGNINLNNKSIDIITPKQNVDISSLDNLFSNKKFLGSVIADGYLKGTLNDFKYNFNLSEGTSKINKIQFNNINANINGSSDEISIDNVVVFYERNKMLGNGKFNFKTRNYSFDLFSKNINLNFLNTLIPENIATNIRGIANIDLKFQNSNQENTGNIKINNLSFDSPTSLLYFKNINTSIKFDDKMLDIDYFNGILNKGSIKGTGFLELPTIEQMKFDPSFYNDLNYEFSLDIDNFNYSLEDYFRTKLSSNLTYANNKLSGNLVINEGEIVGVLKNNEGIILKILKLLIEKIKINKFDSNNVKLKDVLKKAPEFDIKIRLKEEVKIDIPEISSLAYDLKGNILGKFDIVGKDDDISLIGELSISEGSFVLGNEDFEVSRAYLISNKKNGLIQNFNPYLNFTANSDTAYGDMEISLQGELQNLILNIVTSVGSESSSLRNLFQDNNSETNSENSNSVITTLFKIILNNQLTNTVLRPISKTVEDLFSISKFRIVSNIFNENSELDINNSLADTSNLLLFNAHLEAENEIIKDKLYWNLKFGILDSYDETTIPTTADSIGANEFDFIVERRYKNGLSVGVGVSRLNREYDFVNDNIAPNYYLELKFKRKYDNIKEIFLIK